MFFYLLHKIYKLNKRAKKPFFSLSVPVVLLKMIEKKRNLLFDFCCSEVDCVDVSDELAISSSNCFDLSSDVDSDSESECLVIESSALIDTLLVVPCSSAFVD